MNKKAIFNPTEVILYIICILVVALFIFFATWSFLNEEIETTHLETYLLAKKMMNSENCLAYNDEIKVYPRTIDLEKLNNVRIANCYAKPGFGYLIKILDFDRNLIKSAANLNNQQRSDIQICEEVSNHNCLKRTDLINYYSGEELKLGYIQIEVIDFVE